MKHTRGPWRHEKENQTRFDSMTGEKTEKSWHWIKYGSEFENVALVTNNETTEANAHLIAAAPEMLEALELTKDLWMNVDGRATSSACKALDIINQAIKKAKGEL